jgi:hypothetical protein
MMRTFIKTAAIFLTLALVSLGAQSNPPGQGRMGVSGFLDWETGELNFLVSLNLAAAGIGLPGGRSLGEEILKDEYPQLLRPFLLSLAVDSSSTLGDWINRGSLSLALLDALSRGAEKTHPALSADLLSLTGRYTLRIGDLSAALSRHREAAEPPRVLGAAAGADYSSLIVIADGELPVRGRKTRALALPCLFPKIWDGDMNLIYERNMGDPKRQMVRYVPPERIFRPTPSGLEGELGEFAGPRPLRIFARGVFGMEPTDLVIDREDARRILSSKTNRDLLREGRVILVLAAETLGKSLTP